MAWLTPNSATGNRCVLIQLPEEIEWYACLQGAILDLAYSYNWEQYGTLTPAQSAKVFEIASNNIDGNCGMISAIRFEEGMLQVQFCGSATWVNIGNVMRYGARLQDGAIQFDLDGDNIFEITQFINTNTNNYQNGLAPITDVDKLCYTAQKLAEDILDDFQDAMQILDYNTTVVSATVTQVADKLFSSLPAQIATFETGLVLAAALQIAYQVADATLDYIIIQAGDVDVKERVSNFIFCALKDSLIEGEDGVVELVDFEENLISRIGSYFVAVATAGGVDSGYEMDFGEALEGLLDASNAAIAGLACSYVLAEVFFLDALGLKDNWRTVILGYQQQAEYFDSRDCESFDCNSCVDMTMDLTIAKYCSLPREGSGCISGGSTWAIWAEGVGYSSMVCVTGSGGSGGKYARIQVEVDLGSDQDITSIRWLWTGAISGGTQLLNQVYKWVKPSTFTLISDKADVAGDYTWTGTITARYLLFIIEAQGTNSNSPTSTAVLKEIEIQVA